MRKVSRNPSHRLNLLRCCTPSVRTSRNGESRCRSSSWWKDGYRRFREWSSDLLSGLEAGDPMALVGRRRMEQPIRAR